VCADDILDEKPDPRPLLIPNALVGYFGDLIISVAKYKVNKVTVQKDLR
jgi:hypothetical protein